MNGIEVLAGLSAVFGFLYLAWAILRPEDF
jgi:hypothetical protein